MKKNISFKSTKKTTSRVVAPTQLEIDELIHLYKQQQFVEAQFKAEALITRFPKHGFGWKVLGVVLQSLGQLEESLKIKQTAADLSPNDAEAWNNLGNAYQEQNKLEEAEKCLHRSIKISPNFVVAYNNLGVTLEKQNRLKEAEEIYKKALILRSDYAELYYNYGITLQKLDRLIEAKNIYQQAITLQPTHAKAHSNLGLTLKCLSEFTKSEQHFLTALQLDPHFIDAHYNYALLLMLLGRLKEGWEQYQWFYHPKNTNPSKPNFPNLNAKHWQGESLDGKTILIHSEQGFGDMIQFVRYAQHLKAINAIVWVLVTRPLVEIFKTIPWVDHVLNNGEQHQASFDFWVFALALPYRFQTTLDTIPLNVPYLYPNDTKVTWWREWLKQRIPSGHKRVGLVWAGSPNHINDAKRSIEFSEFVIFKNLKNITFVSLQFGEKGKNELETVIEGLSILDSSSFIYDFSDSAALLCHLDLLITVDSAPAHLAGALNLPVWTLISKPFEWRWLLDREYSVWYKSMRLFRQSENGNWTGVLSEVKTALSQL